MIKLENMLVPLSHYRKWLIPFQDEKTREFIRRAKLVHGDNKYNYNFVKYINTHSKVCIVCLDPDHGEFYQEPASHLSKIGCPKCGLDKVRKKIENDRVSFGNNFIRNLKNLYGDKFDYSEIHYVNNRTPITLVCSRHGKFQMTPDVILRGTCECPECRKLKGPGNKVEQDDFIHRANIIHNNKFDYSKTKYVDMHTPIIIGCPVHGDFIQLPYTHLNSKFGCYKCYLEQKSKENLISLEKAKELLREKFGNRYSIKEETYTKFSEIAEIIDSENNNRIFKISPSRLCQRNFVYDEKSKGEYIVRQWLEENNIKYVDELYISEIIRTSRGVKIDFSIKLGNLTIWIEYNGLQHYEFNIYLHRNNIENFKNQLRRDEKVREYCKENSILLIEIPYIYDTKESIFDFLNKTVLKNIDPNTILDYESLFDRPLDYIPYSENENN